MSRIEHVEPQPPSVRAGNPSGTAKKSDEKEQDKIGVDLGLQFEIARVVLVAVWRLSSLELEGGMQSMVDFLDEGYEVLDIGVAQAGTRIMLLDLFNEPARIINANALASVCCTQEGPRKHAQLRRLRPGESGKVPAPPAIDKALFQIHAHARIGALEQSLNFAEERAHEAMITAAGASRWRSRLARSFSARRTSRKPLASSS